MAPVSRVRRGIRDQTLPVPTVHLFHRLLSVRMSLVALAAAIAVSVVGGCVSNRAATHVVVVGRDGACTLARNRLPAGNLVFEFTNRAAIVNELYVMRADDTVVGEVEDVATGTTRTLHADLIAGSYEVRCKPGQQGDGFSAPFTVTGSGGTRPAKAERSIDFEAVDFHYEQHHLGGIEAGRTIGFTMTNRGLQPHEFEVLDPRGTAIGEVAATEPDHRGRATMTFPSAGRFTYQCILVDPSSGRPHSELGMAGTFEVGER